MEGDEIEGGEAVEALTQVPIEEPAEVEETPEGGQAAGGLTRKERKQAYIEATRKAASLETQLAEERRERQRQNEQIAELRGRTEAIQQQQQRPAGDDLGAKVKDLRAKATNHLRVLNETKDQGVAERELAAYYDTLDEIQDVRGAAKLTKLREEIGQSMPDPRVAAHRSTIENDFPWLATNDKARSAAIGYEQVLLSQGKPPTIQTTREACAMAARDHKLGGAPSVSAESRRKFALPSGNEGEGAGGGTQRTVPMNDALKKLAEARYPELEATAAHSKWATTVGQNLKKTG